MDGLNLTEINFLTEIEIETVKHLGSTILGVPPESLTSQFFIEVDKYILSLEDYLQDSLRRLLGLVNMRLISLLMIRSLKPFVNLSEKKKLQYLTKWKTSKITLFRTAYISLQSLFGWAFYIIDETKKEIGHLGPTIGKEHELPTLLQGKEKWSRRG